jgi:hypothetical protein
MFQDEGRFGRISSPRRCWAPRGMRPNVPCQIVREYTYAYAAVSPHDGVMDSLVLPQVNAQAMSLFLGEVSSRHPDEFILMVMDGAGWHKAGELKVPDNMHLIFLPAYSPQLNPVEHVWEELREKYLHKRVFSSLDPLIDELCRGLNELTDHTSRLTSMMSFPHLHMSR